MSHRFPDCAHGRREYDVVLAVHRCPEGVCRPITDEFLARCGWTPIPEDYEWGEVGLIALDVDGGGAL